MEFCSKCGNKVEQRIPSGDSRLRYVCTHCGTIHYQNPRIVAGCVPFIDEKVLLCRRAIAPREGFWTLPAGFLENGETTSQGAARETFEESNADVDILELYTMFSLPHISQVYMFYRARLISDFSPGEESLETRLFSKAEIPWDQLAFPAITQTLEFYFSDFEKDHYPTRTHDIIVDRSRDPIR